MNASIVAGIFVFLFSLVFLIQSFVYPYANRLGPGPGPGFFPIWLNAILLVLSLCYIYESWRGLNASQESMPRGKGLQNVLYIIVCLLIFIVSVAFLGFILSSTIFLFLLLCRSYRWYSSVGISFGVSVFLFWLFASVLGVNLPVNGLGW